ncbi:hypothetical protein PtB15_4B810 [Puccinia triticina]|nr:hypothetical protein PtB15_4B810 [Puccinia triticina]
MALGGMRPSAYGPLAHVGNIKPTLAGEDSYPGPPRTGNGMAARVWIEPKCKLWRSTWGPTERTCGVYHCPRIRIVSASYPFKPNCRTWSDLESRREAWLKYDPTYDLPPRVRTVSRPHTSLGRRPTRAGRRKSSPLATAVGRWSADGAILAHHDPPPTLTQANIPAAPFCEK